MIEMRNVAVYPGSNGVSLGVRSNETSLRGHLGLRAFMKATGGNPCHTYGTVHGTVHPPVILPKGAACRSSTTKHVHVPSCYIQAITSCNKAHVATL